MNRSSHILVVDDEPLMRSLLREGLEAEGYRVSEAGGKAGLMRFLETSDIDLITLDLGLPGGDGLELAREIRAKRNVPIIMITARDTPDDRLTGLEHGADDYIVKPFRLREVLLRIRTVLGRYELLTTSAMRDVQAARYEFAAGLLDVAKRELIGSDGSSIPATDLEMELLGLFLRHPQRVLSRDEITQALYGRDWSPRDRGLDVHITRLRKKIQSSAAQGRLIKAVRNVGYVFTGDVRLR